MHEAEYTPYWAEPFTPWAQTPRCPDESVLNALRCKDRHIQDITKDLENARATLGHFEAAGMEKDKLIAALKQKRMP